MEAVFLKISPHFFSFPNFYFNERTGQSCDFNHTEVANKTEKKGFNALILYYIATEEQ